MKYEEYNKFWSIDLEIGKSITENEFQCLKADKKIWVTKARLSGFEAAKAMKRGVSYYDAGVRAYTGKIIADTFEEAEKYAKQRGWNEEILGCLCGEIPYDSQMINPSDTSKNVN